MSDRSYYEGPDPCQQTEFNDNFTCVFCHTKMHVRDCREAYNIIQTWCTRCGLYTREEVSGNSPAHDFVILTHWYFAKTNQPVRYFGHAILFCIDTIDACRHDMVMRYWEPWTRGIDEEIPF